MTVRARDVAAYILAQTKGQGQTPQAMKMQKLLFYCQAWSLVWDGGPLFTDTIQAWNGGPVVRDVWQSFNGETGTLTSGNPQALSPAQRATVDEVLRFYGPFSGGALSELSHRERPWMDSRAKGQNTSITPDALARFYGTLPELRDCGKRLPESYDAGVRVLLRMTPEEVDSLYEDVQDDGEVLAGAGPEWLSN